MSASLSASLPRQANTSTKKTLNRFHARWARDERDTWIDFCLRFESPKGERLSEALICEVERNQERRRARRKADRARLARTVEMIVANVFWSSFYRASNGISYYRKKDAYRLNQRPSWLTPGALNAAIDHLKELGYIRGETGVWGLFPGTGDASRIFISPKLWSLLAAHGISLGSIAFDPDGMSLIRLKDMAGKTIEIDPADKRVVAMSTILASYNALLAEHRTSIDATTKEIETLLVPEMKARSYVEDGNRRSRRPEFFRTALYRVFNGDWDSGGRFYGGWWQSIPSGWRNRILINDHPTVELDYSGFSIRALYHQEGLNYDDDPYLLDAFGKAGSAAVYRNHVKVIAQAMLNGMPGKQPERVPLKLSPKLPKGLTRRKVREWIEEKHKRIAHHFCNGEGLKLQALDASIAERILQRAVEAGIVVLPIHDSFIVEKDQQEWLKAVMHSSYVEIIGKEPTIH